MGFFDAMGGNGQPLDWSTQKLALYGDSSNPTLQQGVYSNWGDLQNHVHVANQADIQAAQNAILQSHPWLDPNKVGLTGGDDGGGWQWSDFGAVPQAQYTIDGYGGKWTTTPDGAYTQYLGGNPDTVGNYTADIEQDSNNPGNVAAFVRNDHTTGFERAAGVIVPLLAAGIIGMAGGAVVGGAMGAGDAAAAGAASDGTAAGAAGDGAGETAAGAYGGGGGTDLSMSTGEYGSGWYGGETAGGAGGTVSSNGDLSSAADTGYGNSPVDASGAANAGSAVDSGSDINWLKLVQQAAKGYSALNGGSGPVGSGQVGSAPYLGGGSGGHGGAPAFSSAMQMDQQPTKAQQLAQMLTMPTFGMPQASNPTQNDELNNSQNVMRLAAALRR